MRKLSTYLECREGGASKFWSAQREGKALHVQWGRIGTAGQQQVDGSTLGEDGAYIGFDFMSLKSMASTMKLYQGLLEHYDEDDDEDEDELLSHGVALSYSEPQLVVHCGPGRDTGAIYHFSTRNPLRPPIAGSLTEFLQHWLAAGCFSSHRFSALWPHVQRLVPVKISRKQNRWLRYYDAQFPQFLP